MESAEAVRLIYNNLITLITTRTKASPAGV